LLQGDSNGIWGWNTLKPPTTWTTEMHYFEAEFGSTTPKLSDAMFGVVPLAYHHVRWDRFPVITVHGFGHCLVKDIERLQTGASDLLSRVLTVKSFNWFARTAVEWPERKKLLCWDLQNNLDFLSFPWIFQLHAWGPGNVQRQSGSKGSANIEPWWNLTGLHLDSLKSWIVHIDMWNWTSKSPWFKSPTLGNVFFSTGVSWPPKQQIQMFIPSPGRSHPLVARGAVPWFADPTSASSTPVTDPTPATGAP
jgi:hypothetical protein